jgi:hypothetical protein
MGRLVRRQKPNSRESSPSPYPKSLTLLGEVTGVSAYGVRVSAYGFSHRRTYRLRQRLRLRPGYTGRRRVPLVVVPRLARDMEPPLDVACIEPLGGRRHCAPQAPDPAK